MTVLSRLFTPNRDCCSDQFGAAGDDAAGAASDAACTVALVGNPNCGKTTVFNALTGARQRVGNWPEIGRASWVGKSVKGRVYIGGGRVN